MPRLTDATVRKRHAPATATYQSDDVIAGLQLRTAPDGSKSWSLRYRVGRQRKRWTIGSTEAFSLAEARAAARDGLKRIAAGGDPAAEKQQRRAAPTVREFAEVFIEKYAKPRKRSWKADQRRLQIDVVPVLGDRLVQDVTRAEIRDLLDGIAERGAKIVANRVRSLLSTLFNVAIDREVCESNPVTRIKKTLEVSRDRVLTEDEIRVFWQSTATMSEQMRALYRLRLLTAQRGGEVAAMRWQDVDLESGWWTIPAEHAKNGHSHRVPLTPMPLDTLGGLLQVAHKDSDRVFAAHHRHAGAGARGKRQQAEATKQIPIRDFRGHDLRRTATTLMRGMGIERTTTKKILNHLDRDITAVYDRHTYDREKRDALTRWARRVAEIVGENNDGNIVQCPTAG